MAHILYTITDKDGTVRSMGAKNSKGWCSRIWVNYHLLGWSYRRAIRSYQRGHSTKKPEINLSEVEDVNVNIINFKANTVTVIPARTFVAEQLITTDEIEKLIGVPVTLSALQKMVRDEMLSPKVMETAKWFLDAKGIK